MNDEDDDFWTTYIATTPEQDKDFAGCGCGWMVLVVVLVCIVWLVGSL